MATPACTCGACFWCRPTLRSETPRIEPPTVGRIVHYVASDHTHHAAIVTAVFPDGIALTVFYPDHDPKPLAHLAQPDPTGVDPDSWHWPERSS